MKNEIKELYKQYQESEESVIELPSGIRTRYELDEFYELIDYFAYRYGLGGCRSLEEFGKMINETDPAFLNLLFAASQNNIRKEAGEDDEIPHGKIQNLESVAKTELNKIKSKSKRLFGDAKQTAQNAQSVKSVPKMKSFLKSWGVSNEEMKAAERKLSEGKIELNDYSHIDKKTLLSMSPEEFRETLKSMSEDNKKSVNFNISMDTLRRKYK